MLRTFLEDIKNGTSHCVGFLDNDCVEATISRPGIRLRKFISPILRKIYLTQTRYKLIIDQREPLPPSKHGYIFVMSHRQADDIVLGANAVNKSGYVVFGNPYLALETPNGLGLWAYGLILLHRDRKENRRGAYEKMKYVLDHGGNIFVWAEGYWNLCDNGEADQRHNADGHNSDNWLIQDINIGCVKLAQETGAALVPTVLHYDEVGRKRCYAHRGAAVFVGQKDDIFEVKDGLVEKMQNMSFSLMEKYSSYQRAELEACGKTLHEQWAELKTALVADCDIERIGYHLDLADEKRIGKAKVVCPVVTNKEAFSHLEKLNPSWENAFLLRKNHL